MALPNPLLGDRRLGGTFGLKDDLTTSSGLRALAQEEDPQIARKARQVSGEETSVFSKIGNTAKSALTKTLRVLNLPSNIIAGAMDPNKTVSEAIRDGDVPSDLIFGDFKAESKLGKVALFAGKLATDVLLDPLTYITFGAGASLFGIRGATKVGGKALNKPGANLLKRGMENAIDSGLSPDFVKKSFDSMLKRSPALAEKYLDKGGIKFFGKTMLSGQRVSASIAAVPLMKEVDVATRGVRNTIGSLFSKDISVKFGRVPTEFTRMAEKATAKSKVGSVDAVKRLSDIARANKLTVNEAEIVSNAIETGVKLADARLENVSSLISRELDVAFKAESKLGISKDKRLNYVFHHLLKEKASIKNIRPARTSRLGAASKREIKGTIEEINKDVGYEMFDKNIISSSATRLVASQKSIASKEFLVDVSQEYGARAGKASGVPDNYISTSIKELNDYKFHPQIAEQIEKFSTGFAQDEASAAAIRAFDAAQNLWKASVTTTFPAFHGRNAISNVFLNFLDIGLGAVDPRKHKIASSLLLDHKKANKLAQTAYGLGPEAAKAKTELAELMTKPIMKDRFGTVYTFGEMQGVIKNERVAFGSEFVGFMDIDQTVAKQIAKETPKAKTLKNAMGNFNPLSQKFLPFRGGRSVGNAIEEEARLVNFVSNLQKTGDPLLAASRTKQFLFDYQSLSPFEQTYARRLVPFYTFTRKNLEAQAKALATVPGRVSAEVRAVKTLGDAISGGVILTKEEEDSLPDWMKEGIRFAVGRKDGNVSLLRGFQTPFEQPFQAIRPDELMTSISPIASLPVQFISGQDFFRGKPISEVTNAAAFKFAPQAVKTFIGYTEIEGKNKEGKEFSYSVALNPERMWALSQIPPASRALSTLKQVTDDNISLGWKLMQQITGVRLSNVDVEREQKIREREMVDQLQKILDDANVIYTFDIAGLNKNRRISSGNLPLVGLN